MVKHTQTTCRQQPANCLSVFNHFVGSALEGLICDALRDLVPFAKFRKYKNTHGRVLLLGSSMGVFHVF